MHSRESILVYVDYSSYDRKTSHTSITTALVKYDIRCDHNVNISTEILTGTLVSMTIAGSFLAAFSSLRTNPLLFIPIAVNSYLRRVHMIHNIDVIPPLHGYIQTTVITKHLVSHRCNKAQAPISVFLKLTLFFLCTSMMKMKKLFYARNV